MAKKQTAKKKAGRKSIPYTQIEAMAKAGKSALEIAQKLGRTNKGKDCSHSIRAILSRMRTAGWRDAEGRLRKLTVQRVGSQPKKRAAKKARKEPMKKPGTKPKTTAPTQPDGKTLSTGKDE